MADGNNQAAFEQLQSAELEYSGIPAFDYWLGVAALRSGQPSYALIALDRVLYRQPSHAGARLERVAALLQLDQRGAAEHELEQLRALSPPEEAEAAIARYQAVIDGRRQGENAPRHRGRLGMDIGYDGNPQRYPNEIEIDPLQPELRQAVEQLADAGVDVSDYEERVLASEGSAYQRLRGSYDGVFRYDDTTRFRVAVVGQSQRYVDKAAEDFDLSLAQTQFGIEQDLAGERVLTMNATALQGWEGRDFDTLLTRWGGNAELRHPVGLDDRLTWRPRLSTRVEREWAKETRDGGDRVKLRLVASLGYIITPRQRVQLDVNQRLSNYDQEGFALYNDYDRARRRDRTSQAQISWLYALTQDWRFEAKAGFERRRSNIDFFDMRREQVEIGLRYGF